MGGDFVVKNGRRILHRLVVSERPPLHNKEDSNYTFQSYLSSGRSGSFKSKLINEEFYWYPRENMRYRISINDKGQWYETGEMNRNNDWFQFFEMTLDKVEQ